MKPSFQEFVSQYTAMTESQLLKIAQSYDSLVAFAQAALRAEFTHRGLEPPIIEEAEDQLPQARELITVRRYRDLSEAIVARSLLESAGIHVYLHDENLVRLEWQISNFIGGIRLQVAASDQAAALEALDQTVPAAISFAEGAIFDQPRCPSCDSTNVSFEGSSRGLALTSVMLLSIPLPLGAETWLCEACGARWANDDDDLSPEIGHS